MGSGIGGRLRQGGIEVTDGILRQGVHRAGTRQRQKTVVHRHDNDTPLLER